MTCTNDLETARLNCARCGQCVSSCDIMAAIPGRYPGDIATAVLDGDIDTRLAWFIPRCSLCGLCSASCPNEVDVCKMILSARSSMIDNNLVDTSKYRAMEVDKRWNAISLYRKHYGIDLSCYERESCRVAFLPSCTLVNEAPDVALAARDWLERALKEEVALVNDCCGMPLQEMGYRQRYEEYNSALWDKLLSMGVGKLIVACPNCLGRLAQRGSQVGIQTQLIYELMATMGLRAPMYEGEAFTIHDSCPARGTDAGRWVREIMGDNVVVETHFCLDSSRCCGSGGAVGMYDSVLSGLRSQRRASELSDTGADTIVTYCMSSCAALDAAPSSASTCHILELVFSKRVDHKLNRERVAAMWAGQEGAGNDALLQSDESGLPKAARM